jgi:hypothetical protein
MSHVVVWLDRAADQLAAAYLAARVQGVAGMVTDAAALIESLLRSQASSLGVSRGGHQRLAVVPPLAAQFEIHDDGRVVIVTDLRYLPPRG